MFTTGQKIDTCSTSELLEIARQIQEPTIIEIDGKPVEIPRGDLRLQENPWIAQGTMAIVKQDDFAYLMVNPDDVGALLEKVDLGIARRIMPKQDEFSCFSPRTQASIRRTLAMGEKLSKKCVVLK